MTNRTKRNVWMRLRGHDRLATKIRKHLDTGQYALAANLTQSARTRFPESETFLILSARSALLTDNANAAKSSLAKISTRTICCPQDRFELAECYRQLRLYSKSAELLDSVLNDGSIELRRTASQSLVSVRMRMNEWNVALRNAVECIRLRGWHHQHAVKKLAGSCSHESLAEAIKQLQQIDTTDPWINNNRQKMISQFAVAIRDWDLANSSTRAATKAAFQARHPELKWDDSSEPLTPSVLVIGAMKAGSSALFNCLLTHPQFISPQYKELHFFDRHEFTQSPPPKEYYFNQFPRISATARNYITGEASPGYYAVNAADRVKSTLPDAKIIFLRRDPVARAISHLFHNRNTGVQEHSLEALTNGFEPILQLARMPIEQFREAMSEIESGSLPVNRFLLMGCYNLLLRDWKTQFDSKQFLELAFEDFSANLQSTMNRVFDFVGIGPHLVELPKELNTGNYNSRSSELNEVRDRLEHFYDQVESELAKSKARAAKRQKSA